MKSWTQLISYFTTATQNTSAANITWGGNLINDEHRYLLQKYFNNETIYSIPTQGAASQNLTLTGTLSAGATSATLSSPATWTGVTGTYQVSFSDGEMIPVNFTNGSASITWATALVNNVTATIQVQVLLLTGAVSAGATSATLSSNWTGNTIAIQITFSDGEVRLASFTNGATTLTWQVPLQYSVTNQISAGGQQFYSLPPNYSKMKNVTITQGNLQWPMQEILTRQEWDRLNVFPYYANIPVYFYIYPGGDHGGQVGIWPIPSTTNNVLNFAYKYRVPDLSMPDVTPTGTILAATPNTFTSTGLVVTANPQLESRWLQVPSSVGGDNMWYQISNISATTNATLYGPYPGKIPITSQVCNIGQMPLLAEDFQDLLAYRPLMIYFSSINKDPDKASQFKDLYQEKLKQLAEYSGSNTVNVNLGRRPISSNPNLYQSNFGSNP